MNLRHLFVVALVCFSACAMATLTLDSKEPKEPKEPKAQKVYATGHKTPTDIQARIAKSYELHHKRLKSLANVTADKYDCRDLGIVPPVVDQGSCGSCWDFSGCGILTSAFIKAGYGKPDGAFRICEQFVLDCGRNGGCNGDDNTTVLIQCKDTGIPTAADYGPYLATPHGCRSPKKLYKIDDWGFCTTSNQQGVASTQDIKNVMVQYGPIGAAIAADNAFMNVQPGQVFSGNSQNINHDIILCGWDDSKGAWLLRNSWGTSWCDGGYCWIKYGANSVGTEAVWCYAKSIAPDPTPPPNPPNPPPTPGTVTITTLTVGYSDGSSAALKVVPADAEVIHGSMTLKELTEALDRMKKQATTPSTLPELTPKGPCPQESRLDRLEKSLERVLDKLEKK